MSRYYIMPIPKVYQFMKSPIKGYKYRVVFVWKGKQYARDFGNKRYGQFEDRTGLGLYAYKNHFDYVKRRAFWKRFHKYKDNPLYNVFWSLHFLW